MAKTKQDPTLEPGQSSAEDENQGLVLRVPPAEAIFPAEKESEIREHIGKLVTKYTGFKIETNADYEMLKKELNALVKKRTMVDGKDGWRLSVKRLADQIGSKILSILEPAETLLADIKKQYVDAEAIKAAEAKAKAEQLRKDRQTEMFTLGAKYDGSAYVLGNVEIYPEDLPGDGYILKIEKMRAEKARLDEEERIRLENEEKERQAELERQRLAKEAADKLAEENRRLAEENARKDAEMQAMRERIAAIDAAKLEPVTEPVVDTVTEPVFDQPAPKADQTEAVDPSVEQVPPPPSEKTGNNFGGLTASEFVDASRRLAQTGFGVGTGLPPKFNSEIPIQPETVPPTVQPATVPPAKFQPIELNDLDTTEMLHAYQSGAYAMTKAARTKFPSITVSEWKAIWEEFLATTK